MAKVILRAGKAGIVLLLVLLVAGVIFYSGHIFTFAQDVTEDTEIQSQCEIDYSLADTLLKSQEFSEAKVLYDSVAETTADSDLAMKSLARAGRCEIRSGNFAAADQYYNKLKNDYSAHPRLYDNICYFGNSYWNEGKYDKAINIYQLVYENSTDQDLVFKGLTKIAACQIRLGDYISAEGTIDLVIDNHYQHESLHAALTGFAYQYFKQKRYDQAKEYCYFVIQNSSDVELRYKAQLQVMQCETAADNYLAALDAFESLWKNHSSAKIFVKKATRVCGSILQFDTPETVLPYINLALEKTQDIETAVGLLQFKARCYIDLGQTEQAKAVEDEIELYSDQGSYPGVQLALAYRYRKNSDYVRAVEIYDKVLRGSAGETKKLDAWAGLAAVSAWLDDDANAANIVDLLCRDFAGNEKLGLSIALIGEEYYKKAHSLEGLSDDQIKACHRKAISIWQKTIDEIPGSDHKCLAYYLTGLSYQFLRDYSKSIANYHMVLNEYPDNEYASKALFMIGRLYQKTQVTETSIYPAFLAENISDPNGTAETADPNDYTIVTSKTNNVYVNSAKEAYELLLERYPDSPGSAYARQWLMEQGSN